MDKPGKQSQLASIDNSVLSHVAGGETLDDLYDSWSWSFASQSCQDAVEGARQLGAMRGGWAGGQQAGLDAWYNGNACDNWGWF